MGKQFCIIKEVPSPTKRNKHRKEYHVYINGRDAFQTTAKQLAVKIKNRLNEHDKLKAKANLFDEMLEVLKDLKASNSYWWQEVGERIADAVDDVLDKAKELDK